MDSELQPNRPMAPPHLTEDECLDLLHGLCSADERDRCLQHLSNCASCEDLFRALDRVAERVRGGAGRAAAKDPASSRGRPLHPLLLAAAALLLVVAVSAAAWWFNSPERIIRAELHPLPHAGEMRRIRGGAPQDELERLERGLDAYDQGSYTRAADLLASEIGIPGPDRLRRTYLGSALAMSGRYREAASELGLLPDRAVPEPWNAEVRWTWCLSTWAAGETAVADSALRKWSAGPGPLRTRSLQLLERAPFHARPRVRP